eukprot:11218487-Lingulodinium_polyedra.AAC.1
MGVQIRWPLGNAPSRRLARPSQARPGLGGGTMPWPPLRNQWPRQPTGAPLCPPRERRRAQRRT